MRDLLKVTVLNLCLLLSSSVFADSTNYFHEKVAAQKLPEADAAMINKDYPKAISIYESLANNGDKIANYQLGYFYLNGLGVQKDPQRALTYFSKASELQLNDADFALGILYYYG